MGRCKRKKNSLHFHHHPHRRRSFVIVHTITHNHTQTRYILFRILIFYESNNSYHQIHIKLPKTTVLNIVLSLCAKITII